MPKKIPTVNTPTAPETPSESVKSLVLSAGEVAFREWVDTVQIEGDDCSMLKEIKVEGSKNGTYFYRTVIKSKCKAKVTYLVAMYSNDWIVNMEYKYPGIDINSCAD